jgi:hypothetical protein
MCDGLSGDVAVPASLIGFPNCIEIADPGGGLIGLFASGLIGVCPVMASSSSESISLRTGNWVIFLGLNGVGFSSFASEGVAFAAARVDRAAGVGFRTGLARKPVLFVAATLLAVFVFVDMGMTFSLSGSSNVTVFFNTDVAADAVRPDVGREGADVDLALDATSAFGAAVFARLARVVFVVTFDSVSATAFRGLPLVARTGAFTSSSRSADPKSSTSVFFRERPRVAALDVFMIDADPSSSSSSSASTVCDAAFRFVVAVVRALAEAVTILVGLMADSDAFAAARARVILFGGESISILKGKSEPVQRFERSSRMLTANSGKSRTIKLQPEGPLGYVSRE